MAHANRRIKTTTTDGDVCGLPTLPHRLYFAVKCQRRLPVDAWPIGQVPMCLIMQISGDWKVEIKFKFKIRADGGRRRRGFLLRTGRREQM